ncbi:MAG: choice-of-anchor D domain-containing protein [Verrucomicrobiaceae bacterium]|nr:choice-of-anchor D domain-containing protein [Verrucomicrobiaceae bacterium]
MLSLLLTVVLLMQPALFASPQWAMNFNIPGADEAVETVAETVDAYYYGGVFHSIGPVLANNVARVDKATGAITPLGSGTNGVVWSISVIGSDVYVGGNFTTAGGVAANRIAKWDSTTGTWSPLSTGGNNGVSNGTVFCLLTVGAELYAGGSFTSAGGVAVNGITKWNPAAGTFTAFGSGIGPGGSVACMAASGGTVYVGGTFTTAGGLTVNSLAALSGSTWSRFISSDDLFQNHPGVTSSGGGAGTVTALAIYGGALHVGGTFAMAGVTNVNNIAKWDGKWTPLGAGVTYPSGAVGVNSFSVGGGTLFVAGAFSTAGSVTTDGIAGWNGTAWSALGAGMGYTGFSYVQSTLVSGGDLHVVAQSFQRAGNVPASRIARWNITSGTWSAPITGDGMAGRVNTTNVYAILDAGSKIYVGGSFRSAGGVLTDNVACWDKTARTWSALGSGIGGANAGTANVFALAMIGSDLYVGGDFTSAGGITANRVAKWNTVTQTWSALGTGIVRGSNSGRVQALAVMGSDLYVGGDISSAGGIPAAGIAKWNGTSWSALGAGADSYVNALCVQGTDLYVGGQFGSAGGVANTNRIAKWNGATWSALDTGMTGSHVDSLCVLNGVLYVGGFFTAAGSVTSISNIAAWNLSTSSWSRLGPGVASGGTVYSLMAGASELYAGGDFTSAGGVSSAVRIAKWNGSAWSGVNNGVNNVVLALAWIDGEAWVGGGFTHVGAGGNYAGSVPSSAIAVLANPLPHIDITEFEGSSLVDGVSVENFGSRAVGFSSDHYLTINNTGQAPLTISGITIDGTNAADFAVVTAPAATVAAGSGTSMTLRFTPSASGSRSAAIHLVNNDAARTPFDFVLSGQGLSAIESWRQLYFGTTTNSGAAADDATSDGSGLTNLFKYTAGLVPNNAASTFVLDNQPTNGQPGYQTISFGPTFSDRTYTIQYSTGLATWSTLTGPTSGNGGTMSFTDTSAVGAAKFYRVQVVKP